MLQKTTVAHRNTRQREAVLESLRASGRHPTAAELYDAVRTTLPRVSLGTIYRNLERLEEEGVIRKIESAGSEARFDYDPTPHHHVRCSECGRIDDLHDLSMAVDLRQVQQLSGYQDIEQALEFTGICPQCQARSGANSWPDKNQRD